MRRILLLPFIKEISLAWAWREVWREGYSRKNLSADFKAGLIVAFVALPLAMALAIAAGVAPQHGLYTVAISGVVVALLGGSRFQVTGPTAAFVVLLFPVVQKFGLSGLLVAGFLSGIITLGYGLLRLGDIIQYVPHPVTTGFTAGTAVVIATIQIKDFFGLEMPSASVDFIHRLWEIGTNFPTIKVIEVCVAVATALIIYFGQRRLVKLPAPIVALAAVTLGTVLLSWLFPEFEIATIAKRFTYFRRGELLNGVPKGLPPFSLPWFTTDPNTPSFALTWLNIKEILPSAFAISLLGSIETLLSAVVADGMTQKKHNPNSELIALGIGNILCPLFGGIPASGAISRTTTNIRFGATSPLASVFHSLVVLAILLVLAPYIGYIPMAALASLLLFVAWNMSERKHFWNILRNGGFDDRCVLVICFGLTVIFDMTVGVAAGVILAATLFIRRMALLTHADHLQRTVQLSESDVFVVPEHVLYYRVTGSLFFGAAQRAMDRISNLGHNYTHAIIDLENCQFIDMSGAVALDSTLKKLRSLSLKVAVIAVYPDVRRELGNLSIFKDPHPDIRVVEGRGAALRWVAPHAAVALGAAPPLTTTLNDNM